MHAIFKDIRSGALPMRELPRFVLWIVGKSFWPIFVFIALAAIAALARH